jgi:hypothetical protein
MFSRSVKADGNVVALFPFKRLGHHFVISGFQRFDSGKERRANENVRIMIKRLKDRVMAFVDQSNIGAVQKAEHYMRSLDDQLEECDRTDEFITSFNTAPAR